MAMNSRQVADRSGRRAESDHSKDSKDDPRATGARGTNPKAHAHPCRLEPRTADGNGREDRGRQERAKHDPGTGKREAHGLFGQFCRVRPRARDRDPENEGGGCREEKDDCRNECSEDRPQRRTERELGRLQIGFQSSSRESSGEVPWTRIPVNPDSNQSDDVPHCVHTNL
jgi:hypothetical protein